MILYHGSNIEVIEPKLLKIQRDLDFGRGFYTTSDLDQATKWAKRTALRLKSVAGFVSVYEVDDTKLAELKILKFTEANADWLHFVVANRKGTFLSESWDLVCGPVANDQTMSVIDLYLDGRYDEEDAIKHLLTQKLKDQYTFKSESSILLLQCKEVIQV